jgi:alpha-galactosidase
LGWWTADPVRFPNGLAKVMDRIRERGMVAGLWFEIEAMTGNHSRFAELPDEWFFVRHGERVVSHRRYQLDFRQEAVRAFADDAIDRAVGELGCRFLKLDYNFNSGPGSDLGAESPGQALLDYDAALLGWFDGLSARYPDLMIEHCASGGMRLGRPFLDRTHNASNSDEGDPQQIARIACAATSILLPEQNGTWALPKAGEGEEATAFAMLCAIPYRMLLAGEAGDLPESQRPLVAEAVQLHKEIRGDIRSAVPLWPLGLPGYHDAWICAGLRTEAKLYIVLWRRNGGSDDCEIPLPAGVDTGTGRILYPAGFETPWSVAGGSLSVALPPRSARMWSFDVASI